jgi:hypothetical protein
MCTVYKVHQKTGDQKVTIADELILSPCVTLLCKMYMKEDVRCTGNFRFLYLVVVSPCTVYYIVFFSRQINMEKKIRKISLSPSLSVHKIGQGCLSGGHIICDMYSMYILRVTFETVEATTSPIRGRP